MRISSLESEPLVYLAKQYMCVYLYITPAPLNNKQEKGKNKGGQREREREKGAVITELCQSPITTVSTGVPRG